MNAIIYCLRLFVEYILGGIVEFGVGLAIKRLQVSLHYGQLLPFSANPSHCSLSFPFSERTT